MGSRVGVILWVSFVVVVLAVGVPLVASGRILTTRGADFGKTVITYTRWGDPAEMESTRELIAQFEKENPNVVVDVDVVSWEQYWQKIKTAVITDTAQDVWLMSAAYVEQYAEAGHLKDLMEFIRKDPTFSPDDYFPHAFDEYCFRKEGGKLVPVLYGQGALYSLTRDYNTSILYFNRDHFDAQGLSYPDATWTWDDLVGAAKKMTIDFDGDGVTDQWGYGGLSYDYFARIDGGRLMDARAHKSTYSSPEVISAIQFCHDLIYKYRVHPPPTLQLGEGDRFVTGKIAMTIAGVWNIRRFNQSECLWDIAPIPVDVKGRVRHTQGGGVAHCMYARSRHPEEAWKLLKFLSSDISQRELARSGTSVPVLKSAAYSDDFLAPFDRPRRQSYHVIFDNFTTEPHEPQYSKGYQEYMKFIQDTMPSVWRDARTPEEACRLIDEKVNEILAEQYPETKP